MVIQSFGILLWFALWSISDILILPVDTYRSYIVSLVGGYAVVMAVFTVQSSVYQLAKVAHLKSPLYALAIEDAYKLVATLATLHLWRGLWGIIKDFVFTNDTGFMLAWFYHVIGFVVMIILGVSKVTTFSGVFRN
jgi:succinate dehydrogenase hydrophobic anchor subunit